MGKPAKRSFAEIVNDWSKVKSLDYVGKVKAYRKATFDIKNAYAPGVYSPDELVFFMTVLGATKKDSRLQNKILSEWLNVTGYVEGKILLKKNGTVLVDSGLITVFDQENSTKIKEIFKGGYSSECLASAMNLGYMYSFGTGGDGDFNVQLRVIAGTEPLVSIKEMKRVTSVGQSYFLHAPSGRLVVDDLGGFEFPGQGFVNMVEPGYYKLKVFHFQIPNKVSSYYIALCKVDAPGLNSFQELDNLEE